MAKKKQNVWEMALSQLDGVAERIGLTPWIHKVLRKSKRELTVSLPVRMDNGDVQVFTGYRIQHNMSRGPAKGGIRYHPDVTGFLCCNNRIMMSAFGTLSLSIKNR